MLGAIRLSHLWAVSVPFGALFGKRYVHLAAGLCGQPGQARFARLHSPFRGGRQVAVQQLRRGDDGEDLLTFPWQWILRAEKSLSAFFRRCACSFPGKYGKIWLL